MRRRARLMVRDGGEEAPPHREAAAGGPPPCHHLVQELGQKAFSIWMIYGGGGTAIASSRKADRCLSAQSSEQGHGRSADHYLVLSEVPLKLKPVATPPCRIERFRHHFEHDDAVVDRLASACSCHLSRRAGECSEAAEPLSQIFADFAILFGAERLPGIVAERQENFDQIHASESAAAILLKHTY